MFDGKEIPDEILLDSFLAYVSRDERELLSTALKEEDLPDEQHDELIEFLDRFNGRRIPEKGGWRAIVLELDYKELVQRSKFVIDCWKIPIRSGLGNMPPFLSFESVISLYESSKPAVKRVLNLIKAEPESNSQRDVFSYLKRFVRGMDDEKLVNFLRFCTGASMICVKELRVSFVNLDGLARRPVAHTCGCVFELTVTYESFPQFREEMNNVLNSRYWDIDIA